MRKMGPHDPLSPNEIARGHACTWHWKQASGQYTIWRNLSLVQKMTERTQTKTTSMFNKVWINWYSSWRDSLFKSDVLSYLGHLQLLGGSCYLVPIKKMVVEYGLCYSLPSQKSFRFISEMIGLPRLFGLCILINKYNEPGTASLHKR